MAIHQKSLSLRETASVRELRAFVAIYHTGTLSAAAEQLSLTQPAVTALLHALEEKLGARLFDRTTRSVRRTDAANVAIAYAERALGELVGLRDEVRALADGEQGRLRVVATSSVAQTLLPAVVRRYLQQHPGIRLSIDDCAPRDFVDTLLAERADIGIGTLETVAPDLAQTVLSTDVLCAVGLADAGLPDTASITWKRLSSLPAITVRGGYGVRRSIDAAAEAAGCRLGVVQEVNLLNTALAFATAGVGIAIVPQSMLPAAGSAALATLVVRTIVRPTVVRRVALVTRRDRALDAAALRFVDTLKSVLADHDRRSGGGRGRAR